MSFFTSIFERPIFRYGIVIYMVAIMFGIISYFIQIVNETSSTFLRDTKILLHELEFARQRIDVMENIISSESKQQYKELKNKLQDTNLSVLKTY